MVETTNWAQAFRIGSPNARSVEVKKNGLVVKGLKSYKIPFRSVVGFHLDRGIIWNSIRISTKKGEEFHLQGLPKRGSHNFLKIYVTKSWAETQLIFDQVDSLTNSSQYSANQKINVALNSIDEKSYLFQIPDKFLDTKQRRTIKQIEHFRTNHQHLCIASNKKFITLELDSYKSFFDTIEKHPLTENQRKAIVINQDNNLVIAGAGSGKTSVIAARVGYLLEKELCQPEDILLLAFSADARKELEERIQFKDDGSFKAKTFHALGLEIIGEVEGKKPSVSTLATDNKKMTAYIHSVIQKGMSDQEFAAIITSYFQSFFAPYRSIFEFENMGEYYDYIRAHEIRSLNGDLVKSFEECEIANFFYLNGIAYEYERKYEFDTATSKYRQYEPDFFLTDNGIYIEHFGVDRQGNTPDFVNRDEYKEGIKWKRQLHQQNETTLIETFSYEKSEGILLSGLKRKLEEHDVELCPIPSETIFKKLDELGAVDTFSQLVGTFLNHFKSNKRSVRELRETIQQNKDGTRSLAFLELFEMVYDEYEGTLAKEGKIDFNDMIAKATEYVRQGNYKPDFTYVLVDEFQDISVGRSKLLRSLTEEGKPSTLFCVGDDWQAIYRFAGSDISIMRNFEEEFGVTETSALDRTFRYNNQISNVACDFILQNPQQIAKKIEPNTFVDEPRVFIGRPFAKDEDLLNDALSIIINEASGEEQSVLVLARYWFVKPDNFDQTADNCPNLKITFKTVHSSKGLEADYVIVLGMCSGKFGFPSEITDDPILDIVLAQSEGHLNAEERRIFYVALTRAKEAVFLFADRANTSKFITELEESDLEFGFFGAGASTQVECPDCKTGRLIQRDGPHGFFFSCSHFPYCKYSMDACSECGEGLLVKNEGEDVFECSNDDCSHNEQVCPSCNDGRLTIRVNRSTQNQFLGCSNYQTASQCGYTRSVPSQ
jgi:DNA helicase IV